MKIRISLLIIMAFLGEGIKGLYAQSTQIDSLVKTLKIDKEDSNKVKTLNLLSRQLDNTGNYEKAMGYATEAISLSKKISFKKGEANAYKSTGNVYIHQSNYPKALAFYEKALKLFEEIKDKQGIGRCFGSLGNVYQYKSDLPKALEYYLQALKLFEEIGDKQVIGKIYNNIGEVYRNQSNYLKALEYYIKALKEIEKIGDKQEIANCYNNIGIVYIRQPDYPKALEYYSKALELRKEIGDRKGIGQCYISIGYVCYKEHYYPKALNFYLKGLEINEEIGDKQELGECYSNIGNIYKKQRAYSKALKHYLSALKINKEIDDKKGIGTCYNDMSETYDSLLNYKLALEYGHLALQLNQETKNIDQEQESYKNLADVYAKTGAFKEAYINNTRYDLLTDSIYNTTNNKQLSDLKTDVEIEKKEAEFKAETEAQQIISNEEKKRQQFVIYAVGSLLILVLIFALFMFNRFKITQKQKQIIEEQKQLVEENQKQIIDSITYAKRIQHALLTSEKYISNYVKEFFILFKPKDIVSGDFYCAIHLNDKFYLATADCTGHGVPGAFMSMLGINFLNEIMIEKNITRPDEILNQLRTEIIAALNPEGSAEESKDGMDISLCCFDFKASTLEYASANNGIYILRKNLKENFELIELKPDKMPVGKHTGDLRYFTYNKVQLQTGDIVYSYTDGYADQFGGEKGKKYKYKQLEEKLVLMADKHLEMQKHLLNESFNEWKGSLEQVDDVTVIGIKI
jgi:tetratricopeptide (TPR) repeat protein